MDVKKILEQVSMGTLSPEEAGEMLKNLPYEDLGYAKLDLHRKLRSVFPVSHRLPAGARLCRSLKRVLSQQPSQEADGLIIFFSFTLHSFILLC